MPPCLIGMEACVGAHHLSRKLATLGNDARLMPAKYVRPYSKGQKNDFRDAEAIAEAVQRPTMKFVATKTAEQLDLQALHRRTAHDWPPTCNCQTTIAAAVSTSASAYHCLARAPNGASGTAFGVILERAQSISMRRCIHRGGGAGCTIVWCRPY